MRCAKKCFFIIICGDGKQR